MKINHFQMRVPGEFGTISEMADLDKLKLLQMSLVYLLSYSILACCSVICSTIRRPAWMLRFVVVLL